MNSASSRTTPRTARVIALGDTALRLHLQRPGLDARQHPVAAVAQLHRARQEDRRTPRRRRREDRPAHQPRPMDFAVARQGERQGAGLLRRRRRRPLRLRRHAGEGRRHRATSRRSGGSTPCPRNTRRTRPASRSSIPAPEGPSEINATPVFYKNRVYVAIGQDPEHGEGVGRLVCVDATKTGDITKTGRSIWDFKEIHRSISHRLASIPRPACSSSATSAASSIASMPRPARNTGSTT